MQKPTTTERTYTTRLLSLQYKPWKVFFGVQEPYKWNVRRLSPGKTLDIGCGIGRYLQGLPAGSVGLDHNAHSVAYANEHGMVAFTPKEFKKSSYYKLHSYDSILLSHVLEHMSTPAGIKLIRDYTPLLKSNGKILVFCPQEKGYASDSTHCNFHDFTSLTALLEQAGFTVTKAYSFPFHRKIGRIFTHNEFTVVGRKLTN